MDNFILGNGLVAAAEFVFAIIEKLAGSEKAAEVRKGMLYA